MKVKAARVAKAGEKKGGKKQKQRVAVGSDSEFEFGKNCEFKLLKPPTAFEAELQSDVESDAEFRSLSEELQKELPANGGGGEDTISGLEGWLASADCCEGVFCTCAVMAEARQ